MGACTICAVLSAQTPTADHVSGLTLTRRLLVGHTFGELHGELEAGTYDYLPRGELVLALFDLGSGLTPFERDSLILVALNRPGQPSVRELSVNTLLSHFTELQDPLLRSQVLRHAADLALSGTEAAVLQSADRIGSLLQSTAGPESSGYEAEAMAIADIAPGYPSYALAELLRVIAQFSRDRRIVDSCRAAARIILQNLPD